MSFFRHGEIFRSDRMRSTRTHELPGQITRPALNAKNFALRTRYKRSASIQDTLGYCRKTPQLPTVIFYTRERPICRPLAHRLDEFPVGYSSASCTPAALASASPTGSHSATQARRRPSTFQPTANSVLTFCAMPGDNRTIILNARHLKRTLSSYFRYYHQSRTHLSLDKQCPFPREALKVGKIVAIPQLGGLHHRYERIAA